MRAVSTRPNDQNLPVVAGQNLPAHVQQFQNLLEKYSTQLSVIASAKAHHVPIQKHTLMQESALTEKQCDILLEANSTLSGFRNEMWYLLDDTSKIDPNFWKLKHQTVMTYCKYINWVSFIVSMLISFGLGTWFFVTNTDDMSISALVLVSFGVLGMGVGGICLLVLQTLLGSSVLVLERPAIIAEVLQNPMQYLPEELKPEFQKLIEERDATRAMYAEKFRTS